MHSCESTITYATAIEKTQYQTALSASAVQKPKCQSHICTDRLYFIQPLIRCFSLSFALRFMWECVGVHLNYRTHQHHSIEHICQPTHVRRPISMLFSCCNTNIDRKKSGNNLELLMLWQRLLLFSLFFFFGFVHSSIR